MVAHAAHSYAVATVGPAEVGALRTIAPVARAACRQALRRWDHASRSRSSDRERVHAPYSPVLGQAAARTHPTTQVHARTGPGLPHRPHKVVRQLVLPYPPPATPPLGWISYLPIVCSVVSLTLQSGCAMDFKHKDTKQLTQVYLARRSLLVMEVGGAWLSLSVEHFRSRTLTLTRRDRRAMTGCIRWQEGKRTLWARRLFPAALACPSPSGGYLSRQRRTRQQR
jgi:hypothetical protein